MELIQEPGTAHKTLLLQGSQKEVLVLTGRKLIKTWSPEVVGELQSCARRGLNVKVLVEDGLTASLSTSPFRGSGIELRQASRSRLGFFAKVSLQSELWIFDRSQMLMMNERISTARRGEGNFPLAVECLLGEDAAQTTAAYFDLRWHSAQAPLAYSAKNKNFSFHIGRESEPEFFGCLFRAKKNVTLSLPSGRLSKKLERALCQALERGLLVTVYANAQSSDAPSLRRLRRLTEAGLTLKICGQRLGSEFAIADGQSVFMGSLPTSWKPWRSAAGPAFVMQNHKMSQEILSALETQVSVEINGVINRSH